MCTYMVASCQLTTLWELTVPSSMKLSFKFSFRFAHLIIYLCKTALFFFLDLLWVFKMYCCSILLKRYLFILLKHDWRWHVWQILLILYQWTSMWVDICNWLEPDQEFLQGLMYNLWGSQLIFWALLEEAGVRCLWVSAKTCFST